MSVRRMRSAALLLSILAACGSAPAPAPSSGTTSTPSIQPDESPGPAPAEEALGVEPPDPETPPETSPDNPFLDAHNKYRAAHCAPPLAWNGKLEKIANAWAKELAHDCTFEHSQGNSYGENLAMGTLGHLPAEGAVEMWYREVDKYDFKRPGFSMETGHFTQLVWTSTTAVGCGGATCNGMQIWVCNYAPAGNYVGQFPKHVLPTSCR